MRVAVLLDVAKLESTRLPGVDGSIRKCDNIMSDNMKISIKYVIFVDFIMVLV